MELLRLSSIFILGITISLLPFTYSQSCSVEDSQRVKCGFQFISEKACIERQCCFDENAADDIPQCYFNQETTPVLTQWSEWGDCSKDCGEGVQSRTRQCNYNDGQPAPSELCNGQRLEEKQQCNITPCGDGDVTSSSTTEPECVEKYASICKDRKQYCDQSEPVRQLCPVTCGVCGKTTEAPTETPGAAPVCEDQLSTCKSAAKFCKGSIIESSLSKLCPKTCGTCPDGSSSSSSSSTPAPTTAPQPLVTRYPLDVCTDEYETCKRVVSLCETPELQKDLTKYCRRTCGLCFTLPRPTGFPEEEVLPSTTEIVTTTTLPPTTTTTTTTTEATTTIKVTTTSAKATTLKVTTSTMTAENVTLVEMLTTIPDEKIISTTTTKAPTTQAPAPECKDRLSSCSLMKPDMCEKQEYLAKQVCPKTCNRCPAGEDSESRINAKFDHVTEMDGLLGTDEKNEVSTIPAFILELLSAAALTTQEVTSSTTVEPTTTTTTTTAVPTTETPATSTVTITSTQTSSTTTKAVSTTTKDPYHMCKNSIGCGHPDVKKFCEKNIEYILTTCPETCGTVPKECQTGWLSDWSKWSICEVTCGGGTSIRTRTCEKTPESQGKCVGELRQTKKCNAQKCPRSKWSWSWSWSRRSG